MVGTDAGGVNRSDLPPELLRSTEAYHRTRSNGRSSDPRARRSALARASRYPSRANPRRPTWSTRPRSSATGSSSASPSPARRRAGPRPARSGGARRSSSRRGRGRAGAWAARRCPRTIRSGGIGDLRDVLGELVLAVHAVEPLPRRPPRARPRGTGRRPRARAGASPPTGRASRPPGRPPRARTPRDRGRSRASSSRYSRDQLVGHARELAEHLVRRVSVIPT